MRIVFTTFFRESHGGGCGRVSYEIAQAFAQQGHETVLICPGPKTEIKKVAPHLRYLQIRSAGEGDVAIPYLTVKNLQFLFNFLKSFSPQIIHAHDFGPISLSSQFWAINNQIPFIYTSHALPTKTSDFIGESYAFFGKLLDSKFFQKYFTTFLRGCDALIALNKEAQKDIFKYGFKKEIFTIPNGRDLKAYRSCRLANIKEKEKQLTFIGYLSTRKNQKYLLRVMKYLPNNFTLNLIGSPINPGYLKILKDGANKNHLRRVNFLGQVPYKQIPQFLAKTHLFVSVSKIEVQSLVIIEALASGTPVVALSNETTSELVDETVGFCLGKKTSPQIFAQQIEKICSLSPKEYETLCRHAQKKVIHLDWSEIVKQTKQVYQKLVVESKIKKDKREKTKDIKGILELLPSSKFKAFLQKQIQRPQVKNIKKKNIWVFAMAIMVTFFMGLSYWFLNKIKKISSPN